ncbi:MAG: hypothetical protein ACQGVC_21670, partial [Myxococcota bacterium]
MKISWQNLLTAAVVAGLAFGVGLTYQEYRGTEHSRVPRLGGPAPRAQPSVAAAPAAPAQAQPADPAAEPASLSFGT